MVLFGRWLVVSFNLSAAPCEMESNRVAGAKMMRMVNTCGNWVFHGAGYVLPSRPMTAEENEAGCLLLRLSRGEKRSLSEVQVPF